jgi:hypothetical protein
MHDQSQEHVERKDLFTLAYERSLAVALATEALPNSCYANV